MSVLNRLQNSSATAQAARSGYNTFGLLLDVKTAKEVDGQLRLTGTAANSNSQVSRGDPLVITFRGDNASRSVSNFDKGNGKSWRKDEAACAGAVLTLESCYMTGDTEGGAKVVSSRWLNTVRDIHEEKHEDRAALEGVIATAPRVVFANPHPQENEPAKFTLPVVGDKCWGRVKSQRGTFRRDFPASLALDKLKALSPEAKVRVQIEVAEPKESVKVGSRAELEAALRTQLSRGTDAISLLRASDGENVITRAVHVSFKKEGDQYLPDVDRAIADLFSNNIFSRVSDTDGLFAAVASGELTMEAIPVYRLSFAGNANQVDNASYKLVNDLKQGRTQKYAMVFGDHADDFAAVILPGIVHGQVESIADFQPINLIGDEHGTYAIDQFPTAHIVPKAQVGNAAVPLEDDPAQASRPSDVGEEFDQALDAQPEPAAPAPAPSA